MRESSVVGSGHPDKITLEWWDHVVFVGDMYYVVYGVLVFIRLFKYITNK